MGWNEITWDGIAWDGIAWDGLGWDGMRWDEIRQYERTRWSYSSSLCAVLVAPADADAASLGCTHAIQYQRWWSLRHTPG